MQGKWPSALKVCVLASVLVHALAFMAPVAAGHQRAKVRAAAFQAELQLVLPLSVQQAVVLDERDHAPTPAADKVTASADSPGAHAPRHYWAPEDLQQPAIVVSAPDIGQLEGRELQAESLRLRLYISAQGRVDEVRLMNEAVLADWSAVKRLFQATTFIPAQRDGQEVASTLDLEVEIRAIPQAL